MSFFSLRMLKSWNLCIIKALNIIWIAYWSHGQQLMLMAAGVQIHQLIVAYHVIFDDVPTLYEKRMARKRGRQLTAYNWNLSVAHGTPRAALLPQPILNSILADENGAILRSTITFVLEDRLKDLLVWWYYACKEWSQSKAWSLSPLILLLSMAQWWFVS